MPFYVKMNIQYVIIIEGSLILSYNFIKQCHFLKSVDTNERSAKKVPQKL